MIRTNELYEELIKHKQNSNKTKWWEDVIKIDWPANKVDKFNLVSTNWINILFKLQGKTSFSTYKINFRDEIIYGSAKQYTDDKLSQDKVTVQIAKTRESLVDVDYDPNYNFKPELLSMYFKCVELINEVFEYEVDAKIEEGKMFYDFVLNDKERKPMDEYFKQFNIKDIVLITEQNKIGLFNDPRFVYIKKSRFNFIQKTAKNGQNILNHITRFCIRFDKINHKCKAAIYDNTKTVHDPIRNSYTSELIKVNGEDITRYNIHEILKSKSSISGIIKFKICLSIMGISMIADLSHMAVKLNQHNELNIEDICSFDEYEDI